jgi:biopolymer transport protein ExbD
VIRFHCPHCGKRLSAPPDRGGDPATCPGCRRRLTVPRPPRPAEAPHGGDGDDADEPGPLSPPTPRIDPEELIDMTAMVDIVFFLLIFFLVTSMAGIHSSTPLPRPEGDDSGAAASQTLDELEADGDVITVRIGPDDAVEVEDAPLADLADLGFRLSELRRAGRGADGMLVVASGDATNGTAVAVLDAGYDAGMPQVRLAVSTQDDE